MKNIISFFILTGCVFLVNTEMYIQQVLCLFETEADIKAMQASAGVKGTQTEEYAELTAHSLQCMFPEKVEW